jgi:nitrogen fixation protein FixH
MTTSVAKPFTGLHMLLIFLGFFGVVIGVNVFMAVQSARTWTGLVVDNSYVASQNFETVRETIAHQLAAGWSLQTDYADGQISFTALDGTGAPLQLDNVSAFVRRPVGGHDDTTLPMSLQDGRYVAAVALPPGVWDVTVSTTETELGPIQYEHRVMAR